ncbi:MAG: hypothetical protein WCK18_18985 [Prolixibacteraceae bacterium]
MMANFFLPAFSLKEKAPWIIPSSIQIISSYFTKNQTDIYQILKNLIDVCGETRARPIGGAGKTADFTGYMK